MTYAKSRLLHARIWLVLLGVGVWLALHLWIGDIPVHLKFVSEMFLVLFGLYDLCLGDDRRQRIGIGTLLLALLIK